MREEKDPVSSLVREVRGTAWHVDGAYVSRDDGSSATIGGLRLVFRPGGIVVELSYRCDRSEASRTTLRELERTGYMVRFPWAARPNGRAQRLLRSEREVVSEMRRWEAHFAGRSMAIFPTRAGRPFPKDYSRSADLRALATARRAEGWSCTGVTVRRRRTLGERWAGWSVSAWLMLVDDVDEWPRDMSVQVHRGNDKSDPREVGRALIARVKPLGYENSRVPEALGFAMVQRSVASAAAAKRERAQLDRALFDSRDPFARK